MCFQIFRCVFSVTCSMDQHLPQLLLVTWVCVVKHAVSRHVKLQQTREGDHTVNTTQPSVSLSLWAGECRRVACRGALLSPRLGSSDSRWRAVQYLCQAQAPVDTVGEIDHVSVVRQHHDEAVQSLQVGAVQLAVQLGLLHFSWVDCRGEGGRWR